LLSNTLSASWKSRERGFGSIRFSLIEAIASAITGGAVEMAVKRQRTS
jgi:hypothetical protein